MRRQPVSVTRRGSVVARVCARGPVPSCSHQMTDEVHEVEFRLTGCFPSSQHFLGFYGMRMFFTVFTTAHHLSLIRARLIQLTASHPISSRSPSGLVSSGSPSKNLCAIFLRRTCCIPCPSHPNHIPVGVANTVSVDNCANQTR